VVVIGGSVGGLGTALALARDGHRVTLLEKDAAPLPESADEAFEQWERRSCPQLHQSHAFLARMVTLVRDHEPELLQKLLAAGAERLSFRLQAQQYFENPEFEPADDDIVLLACRRITFDWVLRRHVLDTGLVEFRDAMEVTGLRTERDAASGLASVTGVVVSGPDRRDRGGPGGRRQRPSHQARRLARRGRRPEAARRVGVVRHLLQLALLPARARRRAPQPGRHHRG
jgi:2-polyprenyl-6-methoxyphenol hydroxylase-like FAD-dependent oxidoreductase